MNFRKTLLNKYRISTGSLAVAGLCVTVALSALPGCGGGGGSTPAVTSGRSGSFSLTLKWPAPGKLVPAASNSVAAVLSTTSGTVLASQTLQRPASAPWTTTVTFDNLSAGAVILTATAYPLPDAGGIAQATGSARATITSGNQTTVTVDMASTIDHITVTPSAPSWGVGLPLQFTATAYNLAGNVVMTAPQNISWKSGTASVATITSAGVSTGVSVGTSQITATESESGKSGTTTLTVTSNTPPPLTGPIKVVVDSTSKFAYSLDAYTNAISQFKINADGTLASLSANSVSVGNYVYSMITAPGNAAGSLYAITANNVGGTIYQYTINANGTLSPKSTPSLPGTSEPITTAIDPTGKFLYEVDRSSVIRTFAIGADGSLTVSGSDFYSGQSSIDGACVAPDGKAIYLASDFSGIRIVAIHPDGTFATLTNVADYGYDIKVSPNGKYLYLARDKGVGCYTINLDDTITQNGAGVLFGGQNFRMAITPDGNNLYSVSKSAPNNVVAQWTINGDGTLTPHSPATVAAGNGTYDICITPNGKYAYASDYNDNVVSLYQVNADGTLTALAPPTAPG